MKIAERMPLAVYAGWPLILVLLAFGSRKVWWIALTVILAGYWLAFAAYPLPGPEFNYAAVGVPNDWPHNFAGFAICERMIYHGNRAGSVALRNPLDRGMIMLPVPARRVGIQLERMA